MKSIIIDTSSTILLFKSNLLDRLVELYQTLVTDSVYKELTHLDYPGSAEIQKLYESRRIQVVGTLPKKSAGKNTYPALPSLNSGEKDTIRQQMNGRSDFIIIDDGRAAKYCKKAGLPFINALLFPRILYQIRVITKSDFNKKSADIIQLGRYTDRIIDIALKLSDREIQPFLPTI